MAASTYPAPGTSAPTPRTAIQADPAAAAPLSGQHIPALDGVRGIAILLVLAFHLWRDASRLIDLQHPIFKIACFGWCGVDLFFVLSGFLITGILYDSRGSEHYLRNFYARRALRIFPLYYGALFVVAILTVVLPEVKWGTYSLIWQALFLSNFVIIVGGWSAFGDGMSHFWSLAVEEHFYLAWPFLVRWRSRHQLMAAATATIIASFTLRTMLVLIGVSHLGVYASTPTRIDALAIGALCSLAVRGPGGPGAVARPAAMVMLLGAFGVLAIMISRRTILPFDPLMLTAGLTLLALTFGGAIVTGITWQPLRNVLSFAVLRWFGRYSFGIYVWHLIVIYILFYPTVSEVLLGSAPQTAAVILYIFFAVSLILIISLLSYHCWEMPFLRLKRYFPQQSGGNARAASMPTDINSHNAHGVDPGGRYLHNADGSGHGPSAQAKPERTPPIETTSP
jgi:peptidoglycan/LPS O-acetylase OafA/YrhL